MYGSYAQYVSGNGESVRQGVKNMKRNQKGFSLVELIIVIAIMAVLIGLLAPQYLKFVSRAKENTDAQNAVMIADAINAVILDNGISGLDPTPISGAGGTDITGVPGLSELPDSKVDATYIWTISYTDQGVKDIYLNGTKLYP